MKIGSVAGFVARGAHAASDPETLMQNCEITAPVYPVEMIDDEPDGLGYEAVPRGRG